MKTNKKNTKNTKNKKNTKNTKKTRKNKITNDENNLSCSLSNNIKLKYFAIKLLYFMLTYWKKNYPDNWKEILGDVLIEKIEKKIVAKIGFSNEEYEQIIDFIDLYEKEKLFNYLMNKFHKVTSALNNLSEPNLAFYHLNSSTKLQHEFINEVEQIFSAKHITWDFFKNTYLSIEDKNEKNNFNYFMYDLVYERKKGINSLYRNNLGNMEFIRKKVMSEIKSEKNLKKLNKCNKDIIGFENYKDYSIYDSGSIYEIKNSSVYATIMNKYNEPYLGGPSGSASVLYISLFTFYKYPETLKNKILLLGLLIADYIPLWHTLSEILITSYPEIKGKGVPVFNLSKEPVKYSRKVLKIAGL